MNYADYLRSDSWKALARQARKRAGNRCEMCGDLPDHVHHIRYPKNLRNDGLDNLIVLCASCHAKSHGIRGEDMMNGMVLDFDGKKLVACTRSNETLFRFRDVFSALEYGEATHAFKAIGNALLPNQVISSAWGQLPDSCKRVIREEFDGQPDKVVRYVTEKGVYRMAMNSNSKKADQFQDWLADVCMSIRKYGTYPPPKANNMTNTDDIEMAFWQGMLDSIGAARREARQAGMEARQAGMDARQAVIKAETAAASYEKIESELGNMQRDLREYITARSFCRIERIPSGRRDANIKALGSHATKICESEGIKYLPHARMDGEFPANAYPHGVLARAAREIGLLH